MTSPISSASWVVPELGPSLGRLSDPPAPPPASSSLVIVLDDIRLELVTGIFDVAGAARSFMAAGDRESAIASLGRVAWLGLWERAVEAAAQRLADAVNTRLRAAAEDRPVVLAIVVLLIPPIFVTMRAASFEARRWQESDFAE